MSLDGHELHKLGMALVRAVNERAIGHNKYGGVQLRDRGPFSGERLLAEDVVRELENVGYEIVKKLP